MTAKCSGSRVTIPTTKPIVKRVFQGPQRIDVEVVGGLVEQQHVAAGLQELREVQSVALAAREVADAFLLIAALEVERRRVGARRNLALADLQQILAAADLLPHRLLGVERVA